ncbi:MAG: ADP-ribosylglycohydrolase family protein [Lactobacillus sp.]|uniref:ADP-ribosylglycohydrolase family protein n=1 Tax=Bombilactobacillus bombi TaxID=1303590 RepID=UPI0035ED45CE|nr:ADP-ribosylglycohydrolase family protein [Lactobacillus sp.]
MVKINQQILGCLLGGALGDALGYPVEFDQWFEIKEKYGEKGINFANFSGIPLISDDTQMTLFTANALLLEGDVLHNFWDCYQEWLETQFKFHKSDLSQAPKTWLVDYPEIFASREPGRTCIMALMHGQCGTMVRPINQSKGGGAIMRVAPLGLQPQRFTPNQVMQLAAESAALTHGHPLSWLTAAFMAELMQQLLVTQDTLRCCVLTTLQLIKKYFSQIPAIKELVINVERVLQLASEKTEIPISQLGSGAVAEEALAIALYCSLKYENNFSQAIIQAVNHDGDSDSTAALTGQILGCAHGVNDFPREFAAKLELRTAIVKMAWELSK